MPPSLGVPAGPQFQPMALWQKLAPLALIFFCATFNHTLLVNLKVPAFFQLTMPSRVPEERPTLAPYTSVAPAQQPETLQ